MANDSVIKKSNDLLNKITLFFVGMMTNAVLIVCLMKLMQMYGVALSILAVFVLNFILPKKFPQQMYLKAFNLGLLMSNILFLIVGLGLIISIFAAFSSITK